MMPILSPTLTQPYNQTVRDYGIETGGKNENTQDQNETTYDQNENTLHQNEHSCDQNGNSCELSSNQNSFDQSNLQSKRNKKEHLLSQQSLLQLNTTPPKIDSLRQSVNVSPLYLSPNSSHMKSLTITNPNSTRPEHNLLDLKISKRQSGLENYQFIAQCINQGQPIKVDQYFKSNSGIQQSNKNKNQTLVSQSLRKNSSLSQLLQNYKNFQIEHSESVYQKFNLLEFAKMKKSLSQNRYTRVKPVLGIRRLELKGFESYKEFNSLRGSGQTIIKTRYDKK